RQGGDGRDGQLKPDNLRVRLRPGSERAGGPAGVSGFRSTRQNPDVITIRTAEVGDAPGIAAIGRGAVRGGQDAVIGPESAVSIVEQTYSIEPLTACITFCAGAVDAHFLVADDDGQVAGYLHYDCEGPEPELHRIYIDPDRKRGGIGSALLHE